jgi:hypothetical protein
MRESGPQKTGLRNTRAFRRFQINLIKPASRLKWSGKRARRRAGLRDSVHGAVSAIVAIKSLQFEESVHLGRLESGPRLDQVAMRSGGGQANYQCSLAHRACILWHLYGTTHAYRHAEAILRFVFDTVILRSSRDEQHITAHALTSDQASENFVFNRVYQRQNRFEGKQLRTNQSPRGYSMYLHWRRNNGNPSGADSRHRRRRDQPCTLRTSPPNYRQLERIIDNLRLNTAAHRRPSNLNHM